MFESLNANGPKDAMSYLASLLISLIVHTAVFGALVALPLLFFGAMPADDLIAILIEPPSTPIPPPAPIAPAPRPAGHGTSLIEGPIEQVPIQIPNGIHPEMAPPETIGLATIVQGVNALASAPASESAIRAVLALNQPAELPALKPPAPHTPIRVSGRIQEGKLLLRVNPVYPVLAIQTRVSGTVNLEAVIDEEGNVTDLKIVDGHPLLRTAAYEAVRQWKYQPTLIGGEPVPVLATITVIFRIR